jgi:hypothetical protein
MKKLLLTALLITPMCFAQARPPKEICRELGQVNDVTGEFEGCQPVDLQELIDLKELFNSLIVELDHFRGIEADFNPAAVNVRFAKFNDRILELEASRDALSDPALVRKFQARIDKTIRNRDRLHAVDEVCFNADEPPTQVSCGSPRDNAKGAGAQISILNQQLNDVEAAIASIP